MTQSILAKQSKWWQLPATLVLLTGIIVLLWIMISNAWVVFASLQKEVAAAIIVASATVLVSVLSVVVGKYYERKRSIEQELRQKKIPMYEEFIRFWFDLFMSDKLTGEPMKEKRMLEYFNTFTQKLMVWGSDEVVNIWSNYRRGIPVTPSASDALHSMLEFEKLLAAIRKDLGHNNRNLKEGDLLGLFINDMQK
jgi:amino acid transporter